MTNEQAYLMMKELQARIDGISDAESALKAIKSAAQSAYNEYAEQIIISMQSDGLVEDQLFKISESESVDVSDVNALPDEYVRIKREPDKVKIRKDAPDNVNWYSIKKTTKLTLKS